MKAVIYIILQFLNIKIHFYNRFHNTLSVCPPATSQYQNSQSRCTCVYIVHAMCVFVCVCLYLCVTLHSPRCSIYLLFKSDFTACLSYLMQNRVPCIHGSMQYYAPVLDLGTVKRPLVACLVAYAWVSELCASSLNRQLCAFNMSILLTKTSSDEVNLSSTLSHARLTCILQGLQENQGLQDLPC